MRRGLTPVHSGRDGVREEPMGSKVSPTSRRWTKLSGEKISKEQVRQGACSRLDTPHYITNGGIFLASDLRRRGGAGSNATRVKERKKEEDLKEREKEKYLITVLEERVISGFGRVRHCGQSGRKSGGGHVGETQPL